MAYVENGKCGAKAAREAGYASASANVKAWQLLQQPEVRARIEELSAAWWAKRRLEAQQVIERASAIANFDPLSLFDPKTGALLPIAEVPVDARIALAEVELDSKAKTTRVKVSNRIAALQLLASSYGLQREQPPPPANPHTGPIDHVELAKRVAFMLAKAAAVEAIPAPVPAVPRETSEALRA